MKTLGREFQREVRVVFLTVGQLGGTVSGELVGWACEEAATAHADFLSAMDETRFGVLLDYGSHYDLALDPGARAFLSQKYGAADVTVRQQVDAAAARVQRRHRQWIAASGVAVSDRITAAYRTEASRAAHMAAREGRYEDAVTFYEEAPGRTNRIRAHH